ncbi:MAG: glucokinase [Sterolibacterium sp.]|nr:glucokinase [Sterolibacterium sp.]
MRSHPYLVADIGGTTARFALVRTPRGDISEVVSLRCADFAGPLEAALAYLEQCALGEGELKQAAFAVASVVGSDAIKLTNSAWSFECGSLKRVLGIDKLLVCNDFEALASSLPTLAAKDFQPIGAAMPVANLPMVVLGPGTGLGVAAVIPARHGWVAVPGEGGHATLVASDDFEAEILSAARREFAHVSAERLLSGIGLPVLLRAVCAVQGIAAINLPAEEISANGISDRNSPCGMAMALFFAFLGGFAGNLALTFGARGGVFLGGGIMPKLHGALAGSRFRERFEGKGRFQPYLSNIATVTITAPYAALRGLACSLEADSAN